MPRQAGENQRCDDLTFPKIRADVKPFAKMASVSLRLSAGISRAPSRAGCVSNPGDEACHWK